MISVNIWTVPGVRLRFGADASLTTLIAPTPASALSAHAAVSAGARRRAVSAPHPERATGPHLQRDRRTLVYSAAGCSRRATEAGGGEHRQLFRTAPPRGLPPPLSGDQPAFGRYQPRGLGAPAGGQRGRPGDDGTPAGQPSTGNRPFMDKPPVVIAPPQHPLARRRNIKLERIAGKVFLMREPGLALGRPWSASLPTMGRRFARGWR